MMDPTVDPNLKQAQSDAVDFMMRVMESSYPVELKNLRKKVALDYRALLVGDDGKMPATTTMEEIDKIIRNAIRVIAEEETSIEALKKKFNKLVTDSSPTTLIEIKLGHQVTDTGTYLRNLPHVTVVPSQAEIREKMAETERKTDYILGLLTTVIDAEPTYRALEKQIKEASALRKALKGPPTEQYEQIKDMLRIAIARILAKESGKYHGLETEEFDYMSQKIGEKLNLMNHEIGEKHPDLQKTFELAPNEGTRLVQQALHEMREGLLPTHSGEVRARRDTPDTGRSNTSF